MTHKVAKNPFVINIATHGERHAYQREAQVRYGHIDYVAVCARVPIQAPLQYDVNNKSIASTTANNKQLIAKFRLNTFQDEFSLPSRARNVIIDHKMGTMMCRLYFSFMSSSSPSSMWL